jgi:glycine/D-amino acid oxidase-like deaminating enzyme
MRDICVIGAGVVGAAVAFNLSRIDGLRVTIVDAGYPGSGVTAAGTGIVSARSTSDPLYRNFKLEGMEEHLRLASAFPDAPWLTLGGTLQSESGLDDFDAQVSDCASVGIPVEVLRASQVNAMLEPNVDFGGPDVRVAHYTSEFTINGAMLARALFDAAIERGAVAHLGARVKGLDVQADERHRIALADGTALVADAVVNAAGADAGHVAESYDIAMPMSPQPGIGIHVRAPGNPLRRMVWANGVIMKPEADGVLRLRSLAGWGTTSGTAERDNSFTRGLERNEFVAQTIAQAQRLLPTVPQLQPIATMTGVRPYPADGLPRIGAVDAVPGYFEAVTHSGGGLGPFVGRLLAEEIATGVQSPLLKDYRPARFLNPSSADTSIGDIAKSRI